MLTQSRLKQLLNYDPKTGAFTWVARPRVKAGKPAGAHDKHGYLVIGTGHKSYFAHRLAWLYVYGSWPDNVIDHINGIPGDNRITNLRDVSCSTNSQNMRAATARNTSGFLGVTKKHDKWRATISINGKHCHLGLFSDPESAHDAYLKAKREHHTGCTI